MVTDEFTQDLVYLMEKFNKWSGSAHNVNIKTLKQKIDLLFIY